MNLGLAEPAAGAGDVAALHDAGLEDPHAHAPALVPIGTVAFETAPADFVQEHAGVFELAAVHGNHRVARVLDPALLVSSPDFERDPLTAAEVPRVEDEDGVHRARPGHREPREREQCDSREKREERTRRRTGRAHTGDAPRVRKFGVGGHRPRL